jgi:hypothetical protein
VRWGDSREAILALGSPGKFENRNSREEDEKFGTCGSCGSQFERYRGEVDLPTREPPRKV